MKLYHLHTVFGGSWNGGTSKTSKGTCTPRSSIFIGFPTINHPFGGTSILGNLHLFVYIYISLLYSVCIYIYYLYIIYYTYIILCIYIYICIRYIIYYIYYILYIYNIYIYYIYPRLHLHPSSARLHGGGAGGALQAPHATARVEGQAGALHFLGVKSERTGGKWGLPWHGMDVYPVMLSLRRIWVYTQLCYVIIPRYVMGVYPVMLWVYTQLVM